jgi:tetratricopeptide (TPR) repeat protein
MEAANAAPERRQLARVLFGQSNWDNYHAERWYDAVYVLQETLAAGGLGPGEAAALSLQLGDSLHHMGQLDQAEAALRAALAAAPGSARLTATLAWVLMDQGNGDQALLAAEAALAISPDWRAYYVAGMEHLRRCQLEAAAVSFQNGLRLRADEYRFYWQWIRLGDVYWELGEHEKAIEAWEAYLRTFSSASVKEKIAQARHNDLSRRCSAN